MHFAPGGCELFSCGEIKEKENKPATQLYQKSRGLQRGLLVCHCAMAAASSDVCLVVSDGTGRAPGQGLPVRGITGRTGLLLGAIAERESKESRQVLWAHPAWSASCRGSQTIPFARSSNYITSRWCGVSSCWKLGCVAPSDR